MRIATNIEDACSAINHLTLLIPPTYSHVHLPDQTTYLRIIFPRTENPAAKEKRKKIALVLGTS